MASTEHPPQSTVVPGTNLEDLTRPRVALSTAHTGTAPDPEHRCRQHGKSRPTRHCRPRGEADLREVVRAAISAGGRSADTINVIKVGGA